MKVDLHDTDDMRNFIFEVEQKIIVKTRLGYNSLDEAAKNAGDKCGEEYSFWDGFTEALEIFQTMFDIKDERIWP